MLTETKRLEFWASTGILQGGDTVSGAGRGHRARVLKAKANRCFTHIIDLSVLLQSYVSHQWWTSIIHSVPKVPNASRPAEYRPISVHSFIHTEHLYSASSRELLRGAPLVPSIQELLSAS